MEVIGEICSGLMWLWVILDLLSAITKHRFFINIIQESLYILPVVVICWFLFAGDATNIWDLTRLSLWGWIWYDAFKDRDDRWKRRKRKASEKVKVLSSGKLAVVSN